LPRPIGVGLLLCMLERGGHPVVQVGWASRASGQVIATSAVGQWQWWGELVEQWGEAVVQVGPQATYTHRQQALQQTIGLFCCIQAVARDCEQHQHGLH
jgi:hypothetical protein